MNARVSLSWRLAASAAAAILVTWSHGSVSRAADDSPPLLTPWVASGEEPAYPPEAASAGLAGMVIVRVTVDAHGRVRRAAPHSGEAVLSSGAVAAVRSWRFSLPRVGRGVRNTTGVLIFRFDPNDDASRGLLVWGPNWTARHKQAPCDARGPNVVRAGLRTGAPVGPGAAAIGQAPGSDPSGEVGEESPPAGRTLRVSGGALVGKAVYRPRPEWPRLREPVVSDVVMVEVMIDELGMVACAKAVAGHPLLRNAAVETVRHWVFSPTCLRDRPVKVVGALTFKYPA